MRYEEMDPGASSLRSMRLRIWRALPSASDQEIADGLSFYPGAHGLCRFFSFLHPPLTPQHVAGIYAALSPMNTWDTNVANVIEVLRFAKDPTMYDGRFTRGKYRGLTEGLKVWRDSKGRASVTLPKQHPYSNSAGYQRLARFLIAEEIGRLPHPAEHTHHKNRKLWDDRIENLSLLSVEYHGQIHASAICVGRGEDGRFCELEEPENSPFAWPRHGAVLGNQAASA